MHQLHIIGISDQLVLNTFTTANMPQRSMRIKYSIDKNHFTPLTVLQVYNKKLDKHINNCKIYGGRSGIIRK